MKTNEDLVPQSPREILHTFVWCWRGGGDVCRFRTFAEIYHRSLKTNHFQIWQFYKFKGTFSSVANGFFLTGPCQKLKGLLPNCTEMAYFVFKTLIFVKPFWLRIVVLTRETELTGQTSPFVNGSSLLIGTI